MIQIKTANTAWYVKNIDEAYQIAAFLDGKGLSYDSHVIICHEKGIEYSSIQLNNN
jgi:hypothetical protein